VTQQPQTESWRNRVVPVLVLLVLGFFWLVLIGGALSLVLPRSWFTPTPPPLERCLKGQVPEEFQEGDQEALRRLQSLQHESFEQMSRGHSDEWKLALGESGPDLDALLTRQTAETMRAAELISTQWGTACRAAAARAKRSSPTPSNPPAPQTAPPGPPGAP
jgi:hypothetical protein